MIIREILEQRRRSYQIKRRIKKVFVMLAAICFIFCCALVPGIRAFFINAQSDKLVLTVTDTVYQINAMLIFNNPSEGPMLTTPDAIKPIMLTTPDHITLTDSDDAFFQSTEDIVCIVRLEGNYDVNDVDMSSIQAFKEDTSLPIADISIEGNTLSLLFDRGNIEATLGYGSHDIEVNGMFRDGWIYFSGLGNLVIR